MKLQLACDDITLNEALALVDEVQHDIDIIEIGTPMVYAYGMQAVRAMKAQFPAKKVLADLKIMDAGYDEAQIAFQAGADMITVLGVSDNMTIKACVEAAKDYRGEVVVDMICVQNLTQRIAIMEALGVDYVAVHTGVDQQEAGRTPLDDLKVMRAAITSVKLSVAGGISLASLPAYMQEAPDIVIVGSGITHATHPKACAAAIYDALQRRNRL